MRKKWVVQATIVKENRVVFFGPISDPGEAKRFKRWIKTPTHGSESSEYGDCRVVPYERKLHRRKVTPVGSGYM